MNRVTSAAAPALFFKFGYTPGSQEQKVFKQWLTERYHAPSDDLSQQPVDHEGAARFIEFLTAMTNAVADAPGRPQWNDDSFFRRFAKPSVAPVKSAPTSTATP